MDSCHEAPGESGCNFPSWNNLPIGSSVPNDRTYFRLVNLKIPRYSKIDSASLILESNGHFARSNVPNYGQTIRPGGDGNVTIRVEIGAHSNFWWPLWSNPMSNFPMMTSDGQDTVLTNMGWNEEFSFNVTRPLQAFINRGDWSPYNRVLFRFRRTDISDPDGYMFNRG